MKTTSGLIFFSSSESKKFNHRYKTSPFFTETTIIRFIYFTLEHLEHLQQLPSKKCWPLETWLLRKIKWKPFSGTVLTFSLYTILTLWSGEKHLPLHILPLNWLQLHRLFWLQPALQKMKGFLTRSQHLGQPWKQEADQKKQNNQRVTSWHLF